MQSLTIPTRNLGKTGLKVTCLGYGNWITGNKPEEEQNQIQIIKRAIELGINFFDTAEGYGFGVAENLLGKALKEAGTKREKLVISTKIFWGAPRDQTLTYNEYGLSRKHIIEATNNSLKRLQLDYVDIIFCHRPDFETPLEETCKAMSSLIDSGKTFYWGTSEWSAADIAASIEICERLHLHKPVAEQPQYNLLFRDRFESEYRSLFERYQYGTTIWSPIKGGLLSGKYNDGNIPEGSRLDNNPELRETFGKLFSEANKEKSIKMLENLKNLADELGFTQSQLALAWTLVNTDVSVCLLGASNTKQLEDNVQALELCKKWTPEIEQRIEDIMGNQPQAQIDYRTWKQRESRRKVALQNFKF